MQNKRQIPSTKLAIEALEPCTWATRKRWTRI